MRRKYLHNRGRPDHRAHEVRKGCCDEAARVPQWEERHYRAHEVPKRCGDQERKEPPRKQFAVHAQQVP